MLMGTAKSSVQIRLADGGYIIQWMEPTAPTPRKHPEDEGEKPSYLKDEERRMMGPGFRPWYVNTGHRCLEPKVAVRVGLQETLELVGQILGRLEKLEKETPAS